MHEAAQSLGSARTRWEPATRRAALTPDRPVFLQSSLAGGGAPEPPDLYHQGVRKPGVQLTHGYGTTEAPVITMGDPSDTPAN